MLTMYFSKLVFIIFSAAAAIVQLNTNLLEENNKFCVACVSDKHLARRALSKNRSLSILLYFPPFFAFFFKIRKGSSKTNDRMKYVNNLGGLRFHHQIPYFIYQLCYF